VPKVVCPQCGTHIRVSARRLGTRISCGRCAAPFVATGRGRLVRRPLLAAAVAAGALCAAVAWLVLTRLGTR
jgi:uncharacterized paraquat-inducible protein A